MIREPLFQRDGILADCLLLLLKVSTAELLGEVMLHARSSVNIFLHCPENSINLVSNAKFEALTGVVMKTSLLGYNAV
jgi:hypothetical protein